jgi:hypothetical protein
MLAVLLGVPPVTAALTAPSLGKAWNFAVLGRSVVNSGDTRITGDLGFTDDNNVPKEMVRIGAIQSKSAARQALSEAAAAFDRTVCSGSKVEIPETLTSGDCFGPEPRFPSLLTLAGNDDTVWIITINGNLTVDRNSAVQLTGGAHDCNVFWIVRGSVTLGEHTVFAGSILAGGSITLGDGASLSGRAVALGGTVTLVGSSVSVCCPRIGISSGLPPGNVGDIYNQTLTATGGFGSVHFGVLAGSTPIPLDPVTGKLSGPLTMPGHNRFTVVAIDANRCAGVQQEVLDVCPLTLTWCLSPLPRGAVGIPYEVFVTATGGSGHYTYTSTKPPDGLEFSSDGVLKGAPTAPGATPIVATATDTITKCTGTVADRIVICGIGIMPRGLPDGVVGERYQATITAPGAIEPHTLDTISGDLPAELVPVNGRIDGTPKVAGTYVFVVKATDSEGCAVVRTYQLTIRSCAEIKILPETLANGNVGEPYGATISASGGTPGYVFSAEGLPDGVAFNPKTRELSGTPDTAGCFVFRIVVTDSKGCVGVRDYTLCVCGNLEFVQASRLRTATFGVQYRMTLQVAGGVGPYSFRVTDGSLPTWLSLSENGVLAGTPGEDINAVTPNMNPSSGTCFTVTATDSITGCKTTKRRFCVPVRVCSGTVLIDTTFLPNAIRGAAYNEPLLAEGGTAPYTFSIASGALPDGMTLAGGFVTGTPSRAGAFSFSIVATDANDCSSPPQDFLLVVQ